MTTLAENPLFANPLAAPLCRAPHRDAARENSLFPGATNFPDAEAAGRKPAASTAAVAVGNGNSLKSDTDSPTRERRDWPSRCRFDVPWNTAAEQKRVGVEQIASGLEQNDRHVERKTC